MEEFVFSTIIHIEPRPWARPRFNGKRGFLDSKTRAYKRAIQLFMKNEWDKAPLAGPICLDVNFYVKRPKKTKALYPAVRPDLDNYIKSIMDACNGILWKDDAQVTTLKTCKRYTDKECLYPFICLSIWKET